MTAMEFDPDVTVTITRRQPTADEVIRDLQRGDSVHSTWAPDAVAALVRDGHVYVSRGWAKLTAREQKPDHRRGRYKRMESPHVRARAREALMLSMLPATSYAMAEAAGVTVTHVVRLMRRHGVVRVGGEPTPSGGRPRTIWGRP